MKRNRPTYSIAALVAPPIGQHLPTDWRSKTTDCGGTFNRRDLSQLWRELQWTARINSASSENLIQGARLSK